MDEAYVLEKRNKVMENTQLKKDFTKVKNIITSCNNKDQLRVAEKTVNHLIKKHKDNLGEKQLNLLKQLLRLMEIKCKGGNRTEEETLINEKSPITKDFEIAAANAGPPLNQIAFIQEDENHQNEINIGTQIEQNHLPLGDATKLATTNVENMSDYYTNPNFCIIAVESKNGEKKTVRVEKDLYEKSKKGKEQLLLADMEIFHEMLDMNNIRKTKKNKLKRKNSKRFSKTDIYKEIKKRRGTEGWPPLLDEEIDEATGAAGSSGAYEAPISFDNDDFITRTLSKNIIPVSKNGMTKPIGKIMSSGILEEDEVLEEEITTGNDIIDTLLGIFITSRMAGVKTKEIPQYLAELGPELILYFIKFLRRFGYSVDVDYIRNNWNSLLKKALGKYYKEGGIVEPLKDIVWDGGTINYGDESSITYEPRKRKHNSDEEELEEAVDYAGAVGSYVTPAMWAKNKSQWRGAHVPTYKGGEFVNIKKKCKTFPYCNQGAGSVYTSKTSDMEIDNVFNENKIVKKSNLKLK